MKRVLFAFLNLAFVLRVPAADLPPVTFESTAKFEKRRVTEIAVDTILMLTSGSKQYEIHWLTTVRGEVRRSFPFRLTAGEIYRFTIVEEDAGFGMSADAKEQYFLDFTMPALVRVEHGRRLLYDREVCEVHNEKMKRKEVPIEYGLPPPPKGKQPSEKEYRSRFPHYFERCLGGCVVGPWKVRRIYVCEKCKAAHALWAKRNNPTAK